LKILFDTNIILDVLLSRKPFEETAIRLFSAVENNIIQGYLCSTTITTLDYLLSKSIGRDNSKHAIVSVLDLFNITEVNYRTLKAAVDSDFSDFEDAVLYFSATMPVLMALSLVIPMTLPPRNYLFISPMIYGRYSNRPLLGCKQ